MARNDVKQFINSKIIPNDKQEITGNVMNIALNMIMDNFSSEIGNMSNLKTTDKDNLVKAINDTLSLAKASVGYFDIINTSTPEINKSGVFIASEPGVYINFGGVEITQEEFDSGIAFIVVGDGDASKFIAELRAPGKVQPGDQRAVSGNEVHKSTVTNESNRALPQGNEFLVVDRPDLDSDKKLIIVDDDLNILFELGDNVNGLYNEENYDRPDLDLAFIDEKGNVIYEVQNKVSNIDDSKVIELAEKLSLKYTEFGNQPAYVVQPAIPFEDYIGQWDLLMNSKINNPDFPNYITKTQISESSNYAMPIWRYDFKPPKPIGKVIITCCNHGWEKNPSYVMKNFFNKLTNEWSENDMMQWLRWNVHFIVIPVLSPEGYSPNPLVADPVHRGERRVLETVPFDATWTKVGDRITITYNVNDFPNTNGRLDGSTYFSGNGVEKKVYISILDSSDVDSLPNSGLLIDKVNSGNSIDVLFSGGASSSGTCKICVSTDPQRNYDTINPRWEEFISNGTMNGTPYSVQNNKGTKPFSINETAVIRDLLESEENIDLVLDFHSGYVRYYTFNHDPLADLNPILLAQELVSDFHSDEYKMVTSLIPSYAAYAGQKHGIPAYSPEWDFFNTMNEERATQEFRWFANLISICSKYYITQNK